MVTLRLGLLLGLALAAGALVGVGFGQEGSADGSAGATAVSIAVPGSEVVVVGEATSGGQTQASGDFRYPDDGAAVSVPAYVTSAAGGAGSAVSQGVVDVAEVSLFGGEIVVTGLSTRARAQADGGKVTTDSIGTTIASLTVLGQPFPTTPAQSIAVGDWGSLLVGATETLGSDSQRQITVTSIRLTLLAEHRGLPAGTQIDVGKAAAELELRAPETTATAPPATTPRPSRPKPPPAAPEPRTPRPAERKPPALPGPPDIDVTPQLTKGGYVFPIFDQAWFSSTFGAPRANTGWHHGTDIFATFGAPVLAVTDGTLFSVGWNKVGGYRLWLRDRQGNQFYYAHMAAYSPLARNGREVRAGQVIGFNGNTGDARGTPFHVHFEIHPVGMLPLGYDGVVDPYPYLIAWRRVEDVALTAGTGWAPAVAPTTKAPMPAAILLQSVDISTASGLEPGALDRAAAGLSATGGNVLLSGNEPCAECADGGP